MDGGNDVVTAAVDGYWCIRLSLPCSSEEAVQPLGCLAIACVLFIREQEL